MRGLTRNQEGLTGSIKRVEMNRHQRPCLPDRFDSMIATVHSDDNGQVAVTHPFRRQVTNPKRVGIFSANAGHCTFLWDRDSDVIPGAWSSSFPRHYGDFSGVFDIETLGMIEGELPQRAQRLVRDWAERHQADLQEMWKTQRFQQLSGLD